MHLTSVLRLRQYQLGLSGNGIDWSATPQVVFVDVSVTNIGAGAQIDWTAFPTSLIRFSAQHAGFTGPIDLSQITHTGVYLLLAHS